MLSLPTKWVVLSAGCLAAVAVSVTVVLVIVDREPPKDRPPQATTEPDWLAAARDRVEAQKRKDLCGLVDPTERCPK